MKIKSLLIIAVVSLVFVQGTTLAAQWAAPAKPVDRVMLDPNVEALLDFLGSDAGLNTFEANIAAAMSDGRASFVLGTPKNLREFTTPGYRSAIRVEPGERQEESWLVYVNVSGMSVPEAYRVLSGGFPGAQGQAIFMKRLELNGRDFEEQLRAAVAAGKSLAVKISAGASGRLVALTATFTSTAADDIS